MRRVLATLLCLLLPITARAELFPKGPAPLAAVPSGIRVTLILPDGVSLRPGTAMLTIAAAGQSARMPLSKPAAPVAEDGGTRLLLQPTKAAEAALKDLQARFSKKAPPASTMRITLDLCRTVASPHEQPFLLAIRLAPGAPVLPLAAPGDGLSAITGAAPSALAPCP